MTEIEEIVARAKWCSGCETTKPISAFYEYQTTNEISSKCKECRRAYFRSERYRGRKADRRKLMPTSPAEIVRVRRNVAKYTAKHPEKARAKRLVRAAIASGQLIVPETCPKCGRKDTLTKGGARAIQAHHDDYSRPLDIRWLCSRCHADVHMRMSNG